MKITKSRIIFFAIAITYNLLLGLYLKDFLVLSENLTVFYLKKTALRQQCRFEKL